MKALGIVRKIDDLGRVVIPKEVRKSQGWESGHAMEMFMDGNKLVLRSFDQTIERAKIIKSLEGLAQKSDSTADIHEISSVIDYLKGVK